MNNKVCGCWTSTILIGCGLLLLVVLLPLSIRDVDENELAIPYHKVSRSIDEPVEAGKHVFTPDIKLFKYDRKFISNDLEHDCITRDGLVVSLKVTQQYQIKKDDLRTIFYDFGEQEVLDDYIDTIAQDTIRDACALFDGAEFFSRRGDVEAAIISNLTHSVNTAVTHVVPGFIQLKNIQLPTELLTAINKKQLALEDVDVANSERAQKIIEAETRKGEAKLDADILLVNAHASGDAIKVTAQEKANARLLQWSERSKAFIIDLDALKIDAVTYVDDYLFPRLLSHTLTPAQQACLQSCPAAPCWYCFTTASPAVSI